VGEAAQLTLPLLSCRYPESKALITYAIRQLAELAPLSDTGVIINLVAPGLCRTGLGSERGFGFKVFQKVMRLVMARTAEQGSRTLLHGATAGAETHGRWLDTCRIEE
jgi:NAD(P)-dependent dehydrogenase (short-subunit alcohol dehydrogenase family)